MVLYMCTHKCDTMTSCQRLTDINTYLHWALHSKRHHGAVSETDIVISVIIILHVKHYLYKFHANLDTKNVKTKTKQNMMELKKKNLVIVRIVGGCLTRVYIYAK